MLTTLKSVLRLDNSFDACVWAVATCAFWGMMRLGEATVRSRNDFSLLANPSRSSLLRGHDLKGVPYARIDLPKAKTAKPGEKQSIFLAGQGDLCPLAALHNMYEVTKTAATAPLFSWVDARGDVRPITKKSAMERVNEILEQKGWNSTFGHSFRIGGASYYLAKGVNPDILRVAGRWKSNAFEVYLRSFEHTVTTHMGDVQNR